MPATAVPRRRRRSQRPARQRAVRIPSVHQKREPSSSGRIAAGGFGMGFLSCGGITERTARARPAGVWESTVPVFSGISTGTGGRGTLPGRNARSVSVCCQVTIPSFSPVLSGASFSMISASPQAGPQTGNRGSPASSAARALTVTTACAGSPTVSPLGASATVTGEGWARAGAATTAQRRRERVFTAATSSSAARRTPAAY